MKRRELIVLLGGAAAWPLAGHAQQPERVRRVGALIAFRENNTLAQAYLTAFTQALGRFGWVEGKNIGIDYRFAGNDPALFKTYATELVGRSPDVILATSSSAVAVFPGEQREHARQRRGWRWGWRQHVAGAIHV